MKLKGDPAWFEHSVDILMHFVSIADVLGQHFGKDQVVFFFISACLLTDIEECLLVV